MNTYLSFLRTLTSGALLTAGIGFASLSYADDTEIFFGGQSIDSSVRPNVLFVLDNSGSMAWRTDSNSNPYGSQQSRMTVLKQAFSDIIMNTNGINAGLMVLNGSQRLLYPVTNIDNTLPSSATQYAGAPEIAQSADDATQRFDVSSTADIADTSLPMGYVNASTNTPGLATSILANLDAFFLSTKSGVNYSCRMYTSGLTSRNSSICNNGTISNLDIGSGGQSAIFLFRSLGVPANATITSAYLQLTPNETYNNNRAPTLSLSIQQSKTPAALNDSSPLGARTFSTTTQKGPSWAAGNPVQFDITSEMQQLQTVSPSSSSIGDVLMSFTATSGSRSYSFCARGCSSSTLPQLVINYTAPANVLSSRMGALRFENVGIPQGATVTSAKISFVPASTSSDPVTFQVRGQLSSDAPLFGASENLAARAKTTALTTWDAPNWSTQNPPVPVDGPDVTAAMQEIVNQSGWCGNNSAAFFLTPSAGTGSRTAMSYEGGVGLQPTLTVTYTGGESGCINPIIEARVTDAKNDGFETAPSYWNSYSPTLGATTLPLDSGLLAARYENMPVKNGATVLDAKLIMTPAATVSSPSLSTDVSFERADSSAAFQATRGNLSNRNQTSSVSCTINNSNGGWTANGSFTCGGLASSVQTVFNRSGWAPGNALTVFVSPSSDSNLDAKAYESNPAQSLRLRIKLASGGMNSSPYTVRNQLNALVQNLSPTSSTPIVPTLDEAVNYLRSGENGYPSPINSACQTTHLVLLTDGQANQNTDAAKSDIASLAGSCTGDATDDGEKCARTLATWMANNNQISNIDGSTITTHTVGFALDASGEPDATNIKKFLSDLASNGGGGAYNATTAGDLSSAFNDIIQHVISTDSTFVAASAPVNTFNRQDNKDELYFSVFRPQETDAWPGNLKRYRLDTASATIVDADNVAAVNPLTGFFKDSARSFWSASADGNNTAAGGAAANLPAAASRHLYTYIGASPSAAVNLNQANYLLATSNTTITNSVLGISDLTDSASRTAAINYIRGLTATGTERKALGDPLHSSPRLVTYACNSYSDSSYTTCSSEDQSALMSTNEGYLHLFDTSNGQEQFAFMPEPLLANITQLEANAKSTTAKPRPYGMDNTVTLWVNDANGNGVIYGGKDPNSTTPSLLTGLNSGEFVYAYGTMGRGGRNVYALDITDRSNPKLMWLIKGGETAGFEQLGQTWSAPVKTKINVGGTITDVLIFAGGYDPNQDNVNVQTADTMGNALYIVNARTGALIWSASKSSGTLQLSKMNYSMPAPVRVIDLQQNSDGTLANDANQLADQIFVGDMGGQIWRFYINNGNTSGSLVSAGGNGDGVFASVVPADGPSTTDAQRKAKLRRFYNEPDVALLNVNGTLMLTVNIGSGYRGHPLNKLTEDRFYSFRTPVLTKPSTSESTLTESNLYDATDNLVQAGTDSQKADASTAFSTASAGGWMIKLNSSGGEKVLTRALTVNGYVYFNTYEPTTSANSCQAAVGVNRSYVVNLSDATPISTDANSTSPSARYSVVTTTGLLPDPTLVTIGGTSFVINGTKVDKPPQLNTSEYYWIDEDNL